MAPGLLCASWSWLVGLRAEGGASMWGHSLSVGPTWVVLGGGKPCAGSRWKTPRGVACRLHSRRGYLPEQDGNGPTTSRSFRLAQERAEGEASFPSTWMGLGVTPMGSPWIGEDSCHPTSEILRPGGWRAPWHRFWAYGRLHGGWFPVTLASG